MEKSRRVKAVEFLKKLDIFEPYVKGFEDNGRVCFFEDCVGFWVNQAPEVEAKMREIEKEYNCTVYAITHEFAYFGECYSFLIVTNYDEEWDLLLYGEGNIHKAYAYVWNKSKDECSELGFVALMSAGGGIKRIGINP